MITAEIIEIFKSLKSMIWINAQLCRNIYGDNLDISKSEVINTFSGLKLEKNQIDEIFE